MELKDVILSTLAEMEEGSESLDEQRQGSHTEVKETFFEATPESEHIFKKESVSTAPKIESELIYLNSIRERLLVLFEGFQAPNNANIEAKVDMTLNFLEYTLATIDSRVQMLEKGQ